MRPPIYIGVGGAGPLHLREHRAQVERALRAVPLALTVPHEVEPLARGMAAHQPQLHGARRRARCRHGGRLEEPRRAVHAAFRQREQLLRRSGLVRAWKLVSQNASDVLAWMLVDKRVPRLRVKAVTSSASGRGSRAAPRPPIRLHHSQAREESTPGGQTGERRHRQDGAFFAQAASLGGTSGTSTQAGGRSLSPSDLREELEEPDRGGSSESSGTASWPISVSGSSGSSGSACHTCACSVARRSLR